MAFRGGGQGDGKNAGPNQDEVDAALQQLFKAYDLDESGELSRDEFLKIEMRLCFEAGEVFHEDAEMAKITIADTDNSGKVDYEEFRDRQLRTFSENGLTKAQIIAHLQEHAKHVFQERVKMGPRFHAGIRQALKKIFHLYDTSGDGALSPEEWIAAQKLVAMEISDDIDESWIDEAAFGAADENGDGFLQMHEFLEASFSMFEGVKRRSDELLATLNRVVTVLEAKRNEDVKETQLLSILMQTAAKITFQPPHDAWQDEPTEEDQDKNTTAWEEKLQIRLPLHLTTVEEVHAILRLSLHLPADTMMAAYFLGPSQAGESGSSRAVSLLRGERKGEGNIASAMDYLSKVNAAPRLFVKNMRKKPAKLVRQQRAFLEERESLLAKRSGSCWGLDWETQIVGEGSMCPPRPMVVQVGDAVVVEVPQSDEQGEYRYVSTVYMDKTDVLSKPVDENIEPKKSKKKKSAAPVADPLLQLTFVGLKEGKCTMFVEVSWEDQEEKLASAHKLVAPVAENTVARIGPIEVDVQKGGGAPASKDKGAAPFQWWNGEKWSAKKGPAKRKGKKK